MTKRQIVEAIAEKSGLKQRANERQVNKAIELFCKKSKEYIEEAYLYVESGKVTATYAMRIGSGILFREA